METPDRKKRVLMPVVGAAVALAFLGSFCWSFFSDFYRAQPNGDRASKVPLFIFGGFFSLMGLVIIFSLVRGVRRLSKPDDFLPPREEKPWLKRADWAAGKIKSTVNAQTGILIGMALVFCGMGGLFTLLILPKELRNGNFKSLIVLLFPAIGIGLAVAVIRGMMARRRFGDCFFELASVPGVLGGTLEGQIQVGARLQLKHGLHLNLACVRRMVSGSGEDRNVHENILWQAEKVFAPRADLPEPEPGHTGIPVFFRLPAGQPECFAHGHEAILWRLEAKAKMSGPDFRAQFEVPVFKVADTAAVDENSDETDPTAALQMPVEELRRDEHSRIQVTDGPRGREFYFPAARNRGMAAVLTVFFLVWSGFFYALLHSHAPVLFPIVWGVTDALVGWGCFNLWFKSSRVTVDSAGVRAEKRWLLFTHTRNFDATDVERLDTKVGMTSGSQVYQDLQVVTSNGKRITVADNLASKPEAEWLVQEMTKALGRRA